MHGEDTLARLGGDDFVMLQAIRSKGDPAAEAAPPRSASSACWRGPSPQGKTLNVAATIGISIYPNDGRDFVELLKNADAALHHAKETGKDPAHVRAGAQRARC